MASGTLIGTTYSPWTERARWALDFAHIPYRFVSHVAMLGELSLRVRAGSLTRRVTAPVYVSEASGRLDDSWAIAEHAGRSERGRTLFPAGHLAAIEAWNARVEPAMVAGRQLALLRALEDPAALAAVVPELPVSAAGLAAWMGGLGVRFTLRKYRDLAEGPDASEAALRAYLRVLRDALGSRDYLFDAFSYADISAAQALAFVKPRLELFPGRLSAWAEPWHHPDVARDFRDLIAWRDALYARHRVPVGAEGQVAQAASA